MPHESNRLPGGKEWWLGLLLSATVIHNEVKEKQMKQYVYHYHAMSQPSLGNRKRVSGIVGTNYPVVTSEGYESLNKRLAEGMGVDPNRMIINSLTLLHIVDGGEEL